MKQRATWAYLGPTPIALVTSGASGTIAFIRPVGIVIRGGLREGKTISEADVKNLASLPPTDVLR